MVTAKPSVSIHSSHARLEGNSRLVARTAVVTTPGDGVCASERFDIAGKQECEQERHERAERQHLGVLAKILDVGT
jgi:hypothetical protein